MNLSLVGEVIDVGARGRLSALVQHRVKELMHDILCDRMFHAEVVAAGPFHWRGAFAQEFGALFAGNRAYADELADVVYRFCEVKWRERYLTPESPAYDGLTAAQLLDKVEMVSAPSEKEIEDSWQVEIASSDKALRTFYEGSARVRKGKDLGARATPLRPDDLS